MAYWLKWYYRPSFSFDVMKHMAQWWNKTTGMTTDIMTEMKTETKTTIPLPDQDTMVWYFIQSWRLGHASVSQRGVGRRRQWRYGWDQYPIVLYLIQSQRLVHASVSRRGFGWRRQWWCGRRALCIYASEYI